MFNLHDFIMRGIRGMVNAVPEYKIIETAAGWLDKGVLTETDLAEIDALLTPTVEQGTYIGDAVTETTASAMEEEEG